MDSRTPEVKEAILRVAEESGLQGKYRPLSEELNRRGITSPRGSTWTGQKLYNFSVRLGLFQESPAARTDEKRGTAGAVVPPTTDATHTTDAPDIVPGRNTTGAPQDGTQGKATADATQVESCTSTTPAPHLDPETIAVLKQVAEWWKAKGSEMVMRNVTYEMEPSEPAYRVSFPGQKRNTGLRVNSRLLDDALRKAQTSEEAIKTGGGLSPLIERLLWQYLEFDAKYLSKGDA